MTEHEHKHKFVPVEVRWIFVTPDPYGKPVKSNRPLTVISACECGHVKVKYATLVGDP